MVQPGQRDAYRSATSDVTGLESARIVSTYNDSIDVLVNNAAVLSMSDGVLEGVDFGQVMQTIDVNACGPLWVVQQFLPLLQDGHVKLIFQHVVRSREHSRLRTNRLVRLLHVEGRFEHAVAGPWPTTLLRRASE